MQTELDLDAAALEAMTAGEWVGQANDVAAHFGAFVYMVCSGKREADMEGIARMRNRWGLYVALGRAVEAGATAADRWDRWERQRAIDLALAALLKGEPS